MLKKLGVALLILVLILISAVLFVRWRIDHEVRAVTPIAMSTHDVDLSVTLDPDFVPQSLSAASVEPQHPFLSSAGTSGMHAGGYNSDVHRAPVVFSDNPEIRTRRAGGTLPRQCATFTFTSQGYPLIVCGGFTSFRLQLIDPDTLERLAQYDLPMRPSAFEAIVKKDLDIIFGDTSGGAYVFLDNEDRIVLADAKQHIRRIKPVQDQSGDWAFQSVDSWDMRDYVPNDCYHYNNLNPTGECDALTAVLPDYQGLIWWVTRKGRLGTLNPETGAVKMTQLEGEEIQNAFAVDDKAVYIVSDHAQYALSAMDGGEPMIQWRIPYDRGTGRKIGSINQGSGTTPTLLGSDYITFADNADDRIQIVVARRGEIAPDQERVICRVPVFTSGASATDNSMIGYGRSIILENNSGYTHAESQTDYSQIKGGVVRVDVRPDESGCDIIWESDLRVPSVVPKLSLGNGIAYLYSFELLPDGDRVWSLVGLDFETGKEVIRIPTGTGIGFNNNWSAIAIAPNGDAYIGTRRGFVQIREQR